MNSASTRQFMRLKIEDLIWIIYFFILFGNLYSNKLEEDKITHKKYTSENTITTIHLITLSVILIIYIYFLIRSWQDYKRTVDEHQSPHKQKLALYTLIAAVFFLLAGLLAIYVEYHNADDEEIGLV